MIKAFQNTVEQTVSAVALGTVQHTITLDYNSNSKFRVAQDIIYKGKRRGDNHVIIGKLRYRADGWGAYPVIQCEDGEQYPVYPDTLCAFTGYHYVRILANGEETKPEPVFENDLILTYDRNSNIARLLRVRVGNNTKYAIVGESLADGNKPNDFAFAVPLESLCGKYVEYVGNLGERHEITSSIFLDCDFPYVNVCTGDDDLAYLLKCRYLWLVLAPDKQLEVPLGTALKNYVYGGGKLSNEHKKSIDHLVEEFIKSDIPIAYKNPSYIIDDDGVYDFI